jgi:hypothetical protein
MPVAAIRDARRSVAWLRTVGWRAGPAAAALAGTALLVAGCGGTSPAGAVQVASLPTASATATATSSATSHRGDALKFSQCMRAHGVSKFPDPNADGGIAINAGPGSSLDPNGAQWKAAEAACKQYAPQGGAPLDPKAAADLQKQFLAYAKCMRDHGITAFPDPKFEDNHVSLSLPQSINPNSTKFKAADKACQSLMPRPPGGGQGPTQSGGDSGTRTGAGDS